MGCSMSCQAFDSFSAAIQWIFQFSVNSMSHILDDFIFLATSQNICSKYLECFMHLSEELNIPVKASKTVMPTTTVILRGIEVDTILLEARLPRDKVVTALESVKNLVKCRKTTLRLLQSLIGLLNFCCKVVVPGRAFLRRLIDLTCGIKKPSHHVRIMAEKARKDLKAWKFFLHKYNGRSLFLPSKWTSSEHIQLYTDASGLVFAVILGDVWFQEKWHTSWRKCSIAVKELLPIVLAIQIWSANLSNKRVLMLCDNESVGYVINNQTSRDKVIMSLLQSLIVTCMQHNILIRAKHIPGVNNIAADALSRFRNQVAFTKSDPGSYSGYPPALAGIRKVLLGNALAPGVLSTYQKQFSQFISFGQHTLSLNKTFPASTSAVAAFISHLFHLGYASSTMATYMYLSTIAHFHKINDYHDPTASFLVKKMLQGAKRLRPTGDLRAPVTPDFLHPLVQSTSQTTDSYYNRLLVSAMYLLSFHAFLRIGEIAVPSSTKASEVVQLSQIQLQDNLCITFRKYKRYSGPPVILSIPPYQGLFCPIKAMANYLSFRGPIPGPLFAFPDGSPVS